LLAFVSEKRAPDCSRSRTGQRQIVVTVGPLGSRFDRDRSLGSRCGVGHESFRRRAVTMPADSKALRCGKWGGRRSSPNVSIRAQLRPFEIVIRRTTAVVAFRVVQVHNVNDAVTAHNRPKAVVADRVPSRDSKWDPRRAEPSKGSHLRLVRRGGNQAGLSA
jgi:hypothetical protein